MYINVSLVPNPSLILNPLDTKSNTSAFLSAVDSLASNISFATLNGLLK